MVHDAGTSQESGLTPEAKARISRRRGSDCPLIVQWLRVHLPMQGTWAIFLVGEQIAPCSGKIKPIKATTEPPCHI